MIHEESMGTEELTIMSVYNKPNRLLATQIGQEANQLSPSRNRQVSFISPYPLGLEEDQGLQEASYKDVLFTDFEPITDFMESSNRLVFLDRLIYNYQQGLISLGRAAEIAGLHYDIMIDEIRHRGAPLHFGPETPEEAELEERQFLETTRRSRTSHE